MFANQFIGRVPSLDHRGGGANEYFRHPDGVATLLLPAPQTEGQINRLRAGVPHERKPTTNPIFPYTSGLSIFATSASAFFLWHGFPVVWHQFVQSADP